MQTKTKAIIVIVTILVATAGFGIYLFQKSTLAIPDPSAQNIEQPAVKEIPESQNQPEKTDFGTKMPTDFPSDIPVEEGAKVEQSYSLNYDSQKQLSIVFPSAKTVEENFALYEDFLEKQNWNILNMNDDPAVSSLYGNKESNDINVTISESTSDVSVKSQVSVSVLKK